MKSICICGGGALGMVMASVLYNTQELSVRLLTNRPQNWSKLIKTTDSNGKVYKANFETISSNPADVIPQSDIVLLCLPGYLIEETLRKISPCISHQVVGSIVSSTGFFFRVHEILPKKTALFGFQRVPFIARIEKYGSSASLLGYKKQLYMATENLPKDFEEEWSQWLQTPVAHLDNYLEASLSNSNPLLHPARLYGMWHNWAGQAYRRQEFFYANWDEFSSEMYIAMDDEFQKLCRKLNVHVQPILEYYESTDAASLTRKLNSIEAFQSIPAPMIQKENGWIPDFNNRYFTEDFPYGLQIVKDLAKANAVPTPTIDKILAWGLEQIKHQND